jgi:hypothetical protein
MDMPAPTKLQIGIQDISKAERNARGTMIIERIATKAKLELEWKHLKVDELKKVLSAVSETFFPVTYYDPAGGQKTITAYAGDRSVGMMSFAGGVPLYKDIKFSVVEK